MRGFPGSALAGSEEVVEQAVRAGGVTVFPGWEFYAPVAGAEQNLFELMPQAAVLLDEPDAIRKEFDHVWSRIEEMHERSRRGESGAAC